MRIKKKLFLFVMFLVMVFVLSSCGIIPQSPGGKISGRVLIPPSEISKDITGWVPTANAVVTVVDADGITHTVTTDENGYYTFEDIAVNPNTIITATITINGNTIILKDVIPQAVTADEDYDAGTMDPESTALALILEALIISGENPLDIDTDEIKSSDGFLALVSQVTSVLEEGGEVTEDPDIAEMIEDIINPPVPPSPSPSPPTPKPDTTISIAAIPGVTAPVALATPVTSITETDEYTGTVTWNHADATFGYSTVYTATITLTSKTGYTLSGVTENFFTIEGADTATNPADSGVVTAEFPETEEDTGPVYNQTKNTYYDTIQAAIDASSSEDIIVVSTGTYNENIVFDNKNITLKSSDPADPSVVASTIIDGQDLDSVVKFINGDTSKLEGFTIQNGNADNGGGIYIEYSSPNIRGNIIKENIAKSYGGGIEVEQSSPRIEDNTISGNIATISDGGGIFIFDGTNTTIPVITGNTITGNISGYFGGGIALYDQHNATISGNTINGNQTKYCGGGLSVDYNSSPNIENNTITSNSANEGHGGGIAVMQNSDPTINGNTIDGNTASDSGGGIEVDISSPVITDNTITDNIAEGNTAGTGEGGGIVVYGSSSSPAITSNIITGNTADSTGGGIYVFGGLPTIGGSTYTDTDNFNTICGNIPDQVVPNNYLNNNYCGGSDDYTPGSYFTFNSTTRTITGYDTAGGLDVAIPPTIGGIPVEHIGDQAFFNRDLTSITIPDSVITIDRYAFSQNDLEEVIIPDSVTTIDYGAFDTNSLSLLTLGNSLTTIGGYAFYNNQLEEIIIPDSVTAIGSVHFGDGYVFANNLLTSVEFGNSLSIIGYAAFENNNLSSVTIANNVTISNNTFKNNTLDLITIGTHVYIIDSDSSTMGTNPGFPAVYEFNGEGTYNYDYIDEAWKKEEK